MRTIADLKVTFGMVQTQEIRDEGGELLVPSRPVDLSEGYRFFAVPISSLPASEDPMLEFGRQISPPAVQPPVVEGVETPEPPPPPAYSRGLMAVADLEYIYVAAKAEFPYGTLMVE